MFDFGKLFMQCNVLSLMLMCLRSHHSTILILIISSAHAHALQLLGVFIKDVTGCSQLESNGLSVANIMTDTASTSSLSVVDCGGVSHCTSHLIIGSCTPFIAGSYLMLTAFYSSCILPCLRSLPPADHPK